MRGHASSASSSALAALLTLAPNLYAETGEPETPVGDPPGGVEVDVDASANAADAAAPAEAVPDEVEGPGYLPGYRRHPGLGLSPYAPRAGTPPGSLSPAYGAPSPSDEWTFRWSGFMSASLQASFDNDERTGDAPGQSQLTFQVPPDVMDEWAAFTGTRTQPGNWVEMNFAYGNRYVTANVALSTWNPTRPTSYYQIGSQNFLNKIFLSINAPPIEGIRLHWTVGFFSNSYGNLSRYGSGMYSNALVGTNTGVGETTTLEYDLSDKLVGVFEHGIMGDRRGKSPDGVVANSASGASNPAFPATFTHHAHAGLIYHGETEFRVQAHYMHNWSQDDTDQDVDNTMTDFFNETYVRDGRVTVVGVEAGMNHSTFGYLGIGGAYLDADNAFPLRGLQTYAGEGDRIANTWFGEPTIGTGKLLIAGFNYTASLGKIANYPRTFPSNHPDVQLDAAFHVTKTMTDFEPWDGRLRYKYAASGLWHLFSVMSAGFRGDVVVPNSKDGEETFYIVNPFVQFRTSWNTHETITLSYARWFFGDRSRKDGSQTPASELDDSLAALNFTMWF